MSRPPVFEQLRQFVGKPVIEAIDEITKIAISHHYRVNIIDPKFNTCSLDEESDRLNIRTNRDGNIWLFTIG
jgi:hypothetical protein